MEFLSLQQREGFEFDNDIWELLLNGIMAKTIGYFDEVGRSQNSPNGNPVFVFGSPCMCADAVLQILQVCLNRSLSSVCMFD